MQTSKIRKRPSNSSLELLELAFKIFNNLDEDRNKQKAKEQRKSFNSLPGLLGTREKTPTGSEKP